MSEQQRENDPYANLPQNWTASQSGPMVVVAPPSAPEPSATRGVTGLFVLMFLGIAMVTAIYFVMGAWQADQRLKAQQLVSRDSQGLREYIEALALQNAELCRDTVRTPATVERPNLVAQIKEYRASYESECQRAATSGLRDIPGFDLTGSAPQRAGAAASACTKVTPEALSVRPAGAGAVRAAEVQKARELRAALCPRYQSIRR